MRILLSLLMVSNVIGLTSAEEVSSTSQVSIEIQSTCILDNGSGSGSSSFGTLDFGSHTSTANVIDKASTLGSGSIGLKCSPNLLYQITLDLGRNASGASQRMLVNSVSGQLVPYEIYQNAQHTQVWNEINPVSGSGTGNQEWLVLYGLIPGNLATPEAGIYSDQIGVTVTF